MIRVSMPLAIWLLSLTVALVAGAIAGAIVARWWRR